MAIKDVATVKRVAGLDDDNAVQVVCIFERDSEDFTGCLFVRVTSDRVLDRRAAGIDQIHNPAASPSICEQTIMVGLVQPAW